MTTENSYQLPEEFSADEEALLLVNALSVTGQIPRSKDESHNPYKVISGDVDDGSSASLTVFRPTYAHRATSVFNEESRRWVSRQLVFSTIDAHTVTIHEGNLVDIPNARLAEKATVRGIYKVLMDRSPQEDVDKWATRALRVGWLKLDKYHKPSYTRDVVNSFWDKYGESGLLSLMDAGKNIAEEDQLHNANGKTALSKALAKKANALLLTPEHEMSGKVLFDALISEDMLDKELILNVESMSHPYIAQVVAKLAAEEDVFIDIAPHARRNMATLLLKSALTRFEDDSSGRHHQNTRAIRTTIFNPDSYSQVLALKDVIIFSNAITQKLNAQREESKQQQLLHVDEAGSAMLVNLGEAIFRILSITATNEEQIAENRSYAEVFDALMAPYYKSYSASRQITIADICARYPDATGDLIFALKDESAREGFSAASRLYREVSSTFGSHARYQKRRPGYGVIS